MNDKPYVANYPPLAEWLEKHEARCMWQVPSQPKPEDAEYDWTPQAYIECYLVGKRLCIVVVHADRHGWELYTSLDDPKIAATLADAEKRLGIG